MVLPALAAPLVGAAVSAGKKKLGEAKDKKVAELKGKAAAKLASEKQKIMGKKAQEATAQRRTDRAAAEKAEQQAKAAKRSQRGARKGGISKRRSNKTRGASHGAKVQALKAKAGKAASAAAKAGSSMGKRLQRTIHGYRKEGPPKAAFDGGVTILPVVPLGAAKGAYGKKPKGGLLGLYSAGLATAMGGRELGWWDF